LGFSGTSTAAPPSSGSSLSTSVQGANAVDGNANIIGTDAGATATIGAGTNTLILTVGTSGSQTLTLTQGTNLTKADIAADINTQIAGNGNFTGANAVTAKVVNNQIVLEANTPGAAVTTGAGTANAALGLTAAFSSSHHLLTNSGRRACEPCGHRAQSGYSRHHHLGRTAGRSANQNCRQQRFDGGGHPSYQRDAGQ
jgi:hypothetical protein